MCKEKKIEIRTSEAPEPVGPYSQAVSVGGTVFVSGQIPLTSDNILVKGGIKEQTAQVIDNVEKILVSSGLCLDNVAKVDVFMKDLENFSEMDEVYLSKFVSGVKPARCVVQAARLPKDVLIELSCIACR
ncbi:MAG: Rid family detoxifying hydrolase [Candidatus Aadella gelida]|nr:Rid family detoxifying hydrolase [Candidatus Aadella gelida]